MIMSNLFMFYIPLGLTAGNLIITLLYRGMLNKHEANIETLKKIINMHIKEQHRYISEIISHRFTDAERFIMQNRIMEKQNGT